MYNKDENTAMYKGDEGLIDVDFGGGWLVSSLDSTLSRDEYERIGFELLDDGNFGDYLPWAMDYTEDGRGVVYIIGGDQERITLHPDGTTITPA